MGRFSRAGRVLVAATLLMIALAGALPARPARAAKAPWCPPQTGVCSEGAFLDFWGNVDAATGGYALDIIGLPISPTLQTPGGLIVQFYERAVFEWHPENPAQYQVLLTRLGATMIDGNSDLKQLAGLPAIPCQDARACYLFAQTQHTVRGVFKAYYEGNGGLPVFGMAMTEQFPARIGGQDYTAQIFERNRFEAHPENSNPRYQVLLGRLGAEFLAALGGQVRTWPTVKTPSYGDGGAAPQPLPTPTSSDQQLVATAYSLISSVPEKRPIVDNLIARNVTWSFAALPEGVLGFYALRTNSITYSTLLRAMDPHDLGAVTGHEGQHAYDILNFGPPRTAADCYALEFRGFVSEATLWRAWYGDRGKANPVNSFERSENAIMLDIAFNNGTQVKAFIAEAYKQQGGSRLEPGDDAAPSPYATADGLSPLDTAFFPDVAAQVAEVAAGPPVQAAALGVPAPDWPKR